MPSLRSLAPAAGLLLLLLPSLARAIAFTSPGPSDVLARGSEVTARWTTVDTDPGVFSLYAWNFAAWPPYYEGLAYGVDAAAGAATVRLPCRLAAGGGWQLTAINDTNVYVLYAQTAAFNVTAASDDDDDAAACVDPPAPSSGACHAVPPTTVFVTQTAGSVPAPTATSVSSAIVTASIIQPGVVDGTMTKEPTVAATLAPALLSVEVDVDIL